ncbi:CAHM6 protein, partial [Acrocephalus arundinaceus]|nr:CAHM6 protein [Acrocephalus arundinaceus]
MDRLQKLVDFCIRQQTILTCSVVSLLTIASEKIFSSAVFKCPCNSKNMLYGCAFILAPAFILLVLSFMVNARTWHLLTGKCSSKKQPQSSPWGTCARCCQVLLPMTAKTLVAPLTWIAVALLETRFYECAASGSSVIQSYFCKDNGNDCRNLLLQVPCHEELLAYFSSERLSLHAQSQLIGWLLITGIMTVALISTCVRYCRSLVSYLQLRLPKIYRKKEDELSEIRGKEHATELAETNTNQCFEATDPEPSNTPSIEDGQNTSICHTTNSQEQNYSKLHTNKSTNRGNSHIIKAEVQDNHALADGNEVQACDAKL